MTNSERQILFSIATLQAVKKADIYPLLSTAENPHALGDALSEWRADLSGHICFVLTKLDKAQQENH